MKIKRLLAGSLAAITAGATIALVAAQTAPSLGDFVKTEAGKLVSPMIVIGGSDASLIGSQFPYDVVGASDIAAAVAGYATTPVTLPGVTEASVSGGTKLDTTNTKLYLGDALTKSGIRTTVTSNDLPTLLKTGTFSDDAGTTYTYDQYISFKWGNITFGKSGGDLSDPKLYIDTGTSTAAPLYETSVVFNKVLNLSSNDVIGNDITLFGNKYTIGSGSTFTTTPYKLVLFGSSNSMVLADGEERTVVVNGKEYKVKSLGASSTTVAVIQVDGESKTVNKGGSYKVGGLDIYVDDIFYFGKETQVSSIKISAGSEKLTLQNGATVKKGTAEDSVDGTLVTLTGTAGSGLSKLTVAATAKSSSDDYILEGGAFTDPLWKSFKVAFGGISGGATDMVTIDNSGTAAATLKFTDFRGNEKSFTWAYTGSTTFAPNLNETSTRKFHVVEGEWIAKNDYALIAPSVESDFGHILQYSTSSSLGSSGAYVEFRDLMSGQTNRVYLLSSGYDNASFYIDGQQYFVDWEGTGSERIRLSWGTGADFVATPIAFTTGTKTMLYPLIKTKRGAYITLVEPVTLTNATTYELPTNISFLYDTNLGINGTAPTYGQLKYNLTSAASASLTIATTGGANVTTPGVLLLEEKGKDATETEVKDAVFATIADGSGTGVDTSVIFSTTYMTAAVKITSDNTLTSDNSVTVYGDRRGTFVKHDTDSQGLIEITYPDDQAVAWVAVGSDPKFSVGTEGGATVNAAIKIDSPVAKLDSEVNTAALTSDLILVGGPCVNKLVAKLAEDATSGVPACNAWNLKTGLIKQVTNAFGSGKKALVVAGNQGTDTRQLAAEVMKGTLSFQA
ncbi:MAG: S-layer protein [Candidatus Omnitrophica bacterium]|nr:S-layer protein [Candidatus Omnitrophota bacterium]MBI2674853.1 S-layer protein [Candidatus Aenigmarchaeota archaeon]